MTNWLKRMFGGSDESSTSEAPEPATVPEPPATPAAEPESSDGGVSDAGDEPA